jgi:hypothetical protein
VEARSPDRECVHSLTAYNRSPPYFGDTVEGIQHGYQIVPIDFKFRHSELASSDDMEWQPDNTFTRRLSYGYISAFLFVTVESLGSPPMAQLSWLGEPVPGGMRMSRKCRCSPGTRGKKSRLQLLSLRLQLTVRLDGDDALLLRYCTVYCMMAFRGVLGQRAPIN